MAVLGLVGGPLVCASGIAMMFGVFEPGSVWQVVTVIPEFLWELSLGIWLVVKGFNPSAAILSESVTPDGGVANSVRRPSIVPSEA
jgi:hypothetical protein